MYILQYKNVYVIKNSKYGELQIAKRNKTLKCLRYKHCSYQLKLHQAGIAHPSSPNVLTFYVRIFLFLLMLFPFH